MAFIDAFNRYSADQALTADAASTNVIDHVNAGRLGDGEPMAVVFTVDVAAAGGGTLNFQLQTDDNEAFASAATVCQTGAVAAASLTAGAQIVLPIPPGVATERYTRVNYDLTTMTGITVTARLTPMSMIPSGALYPDNITIS
jgi:hypothetical protein